MDPWTKVVALTAIAVAGLVGLNIAMLRRVREAKRRGASLRDDGERG